MAEKLKDEADRKLESLFKTEAVRDDGFSVQVINRVRRQIWVRRLAMPIAILLGVVIAAKPLMQLSRIVADLVAAVPLDIGGFDSAALIGMPQLSTIILGIMLLATVLMASRMLED